MKTFVASDLQRDRKTVMAAARKDRALIRDTDGTVLAMTDAGRFAALERIGRVASDFASLAASLDKASVPASTLGVFSWAATWSRERRRMLLHDVADALALSVSLTDSEPVDAVLRQARDAVTPQRRLEGSTMWKELDEEDRERLRTGRGLPRRARASA